MNSLDFGRNRDTDTVAMFDKFLFYLGTYNPLLQELKLSYSYNNIKSCPIETIKIFTMGCPQLYCENLYGTI